MMGTQSCRITVAIEELTARTKGLREEKSIAGDELLLPQFIEMTSADPLLACSGALDAIAEIASARTHIGHYSTSSGRAVRRQICIERAWREFLCVFPAQPVAVVKNKNLICLHYRCYVASLMMLVVVALEARRRAEVRVNSKSECGSSIVKMTMARGFPTSARAMVKR